MKKCIVLKQMQDPANHDKFAKLKVPIRLTKKTAPYFGVVRCPKYKSMTRIFSKKCIEY